MASAGAHGDDLGVRAGMKTRSWLLWVVAFLVTAGMAVYQRVTGPTYPVRGTVVVGGPETALENATEVVFKLPRSHGGEGDAEIRLLVPDTTVTGRMEFRRYLSQDDWSEQRLARRDDYLVARIPHQPPAGKVMYRLFLGKGGASSTPLTSEPVIIRFKGAVPGLVLIAHILGMVGVMLLSARAGLEALFKGSQAYRLTLWTIGFLLVGGLVLGPVVQKYAFGTFWMGWPLGHDLTDNKAAVAMLFWLLAFWRIRKNRASYGWVIVASVISLIIWLTPHSLLGSELDYTKMPQ